MSDMDLAAKCLDFCQALATQGQTTSLSVTIGSSFSFNMDTQASQDTRSTVKLTKKKQSPSTLKRNKKRKENFHKKLLSSSPINNPTPQSPSASNPSPPNPPPPNPSPHDLLPSPPDPFPSNKRKVKKFPFKLYPSLPSLPNPYPPTLNPSNISSKSSNPKSRPSAASTPTPSSATLTPCISVSCDLRFSSWSEMMKHIQRDHS